MKALLDYLRQFDTLNEQQAEMVISKAKLLELPKETYFSEAGKVPKQVGFILEGVLRFCYYNNKGQEVTHYFVGEGQFITDFPRFEAQIISAEYIQTVTDCKLLVFTKEDWDYLLATIITWSSIETKMVKKCLNESISRRSPMVSNDATERYLSFLESFPALVNRIPLAYVASYVGVTQQSLSRIRKNLR
jgi:CRP-like cAMP-binding protein